MNIEDGIYQEFRSKFDSAFENNAELRLTVARIETTIAAAQERLYEQMAEIAKSLREITLVSDTLNDLRRRVNKEKEENSILVEKIELLNKEIIGLKRTTNEIDNLKREMRHEKIISYINMTILAILAGGIIIHIL